jgi:hypothetical protein
MRNVLIIFCANEVLMAPSIHHVGRKENKLLIIQKKNQCS